jgi:hypothetical protein
MLLPSTEWIKKTFLWYVCTNSVSCLFSCNLYWLYNV